MIRILQQRPRRRQRGIEWLVPVLAASVAFGSSSYAGPDAHAIEEFSANTIKEKVIGSWIIDVTGTKTGRGAVYSTFDFHTPFVSFGYFLKNPAMETVNPDKIEHNHSDHHGTHGTVTYYMDIYKGAVGTLSFIGIVRGTITPGTAPPASSVSLSGELWDPFIFSDSDPDAPFNFVAEGLDHSLSLNSGTSFPAVYAVDPDTFGAIPSETYMIYKARVAPGLVPDPDEFWASPSDYIDLYTMTISADVDHVVSVEIEFGSSTADFVLDYRDMAGVPLDPNDPAQVDAVENSIAANFVDGVLMVDLEDVFTVGFDPDDSLGQTKGGFTYGSSSETSLTAYEVPAPDCIDLTVSPLVAGSAAIWDVSGATPGTRVAIVYGLQPGETVVDNFGGYCATFGIKGVRQNSVLCQKTVDGNGQISCQATIPGNLIGRRVLSQAAVQGTCPDDCVSNLDDQVIQ